MKKSNGNDDQQLVLTNLSSESRESVEAVTY